MLDPLSRICVVLCRPSHPGNIGACARALKTMGLSQLAVVTPEVALDEQAFAMASNAGDVLEQATIYSDLDQALAQVALSFAFTSRHRRVSPAAVSFADFSPQALSVSLHGQVALVFGNERTGLTNEELFACNHLVSIESNPHYPSLNLAAAVQVVTHAVFSEYQAELAHQTETQDAANRYALGAQLMSFYQQLDQFMQESGFMAERSHISLSKKMRRIFSKAKLETHEVDMLRGLLAAAAAKWSPKR